MASLYKKPVIVTDPKTGKRTKVKSKKWWGRYRDENGIERRVPLAADKMAAQAMLNERLKRTERRSAGINDPFEEHRRQTLAKHLEAYEIYLFGLGNTAKHARQTCGRVKAILGGCGFARFTDISASAVVEWLKKQRTERLGIKSSNYYLACLKAFLGWMVKDARADRNPLAHLAGLNAKTDVRRKRRCISPEEFYRLVDAARSAGTMRKLSGPDRAMLYVVAANSGLRSSELESLTPESFNLEGDSPAVTVEAAYSKRRRRDQQPLSKEIAAQIGSWLKGKPRRQKLWPGGWKQHGAKLVRADLIAARQKWLDEAATEMERQLREDSTFLAFEDEAGHVFDFHGIRHQYVSNLVAAGLNPKAAQALARHSTVTLTMDVYAHLQDGSMTRLLDSVPLFASADGDKRGQEKAGAEVPTMVPKGAEYGAIVPASLTQQPASNCSEPAETACDKSKRTAEMCTDPHLAASECSKGPSRIRTGDSGFAIRCLTTWRRGQGI